MKLPLRSMLAATLTLGGAALNAQAVTYEYRAVSRGLSVQPSSAPTSPTTPSTPSTPKPPEVVPVKTLSISSPAAFAPTDVNAPAAPQTLTVTNTGNALVTVASVQLETGAPDFSVSSTCTTLAPAATCAITVNFKPTAGNLRTGTVKVTSDEQAGSQTISLSGTGVAPKVYATWNPNRKGPGATLSNGNLTVVGNITGAVESNIGKSKGKWYWEIKFDAHTSGAYSMIGISTGGAKLDRWPGEDAAAYSYYGINGYVYNASAGKAYGASFDAGTVIGVALDMDAGTLGYYKNGVYQGLAYTGLTGTYYAIVGGGASASALTHTANFGAKPFVYPAPTGFNAGLYN